MQAVRMALILVALVIIACPDMGCGKKPRQVKHDSKQTSKDADQTGETEKLDAVSAAKLQESEFESFQRFLNANPEAYAEIVSRAKAAAEINPKSAIAAKCREIVENTTGKLKGAAVAEFGKAKKTAEEMLYAGAFENAADVWARFPKEYLIDEIAADVKTQETGIRFERLAADEWKTYELVYTNYTRKGLYEEAKDVIAEYEASLDNSAKIAKLEYVGTVFSRRMDDFGKVLEENVKVEKEDMAKIAPVDSIKKGESAWRFGGDATWNLNNGTLTGDYTGGGAGYSSAATGLSAWKDVYITFEYRMKSGALALGIRGTPKASGSGYSYELLGFKNAAIKTGQWYKASVKIKGEYAVARIEGTRIKEEIATPRKQGRIAFFLLPGASVEIRELNVRVLSQGKSVDEEEIE